jgi:class 3 adenylate cyclase
MIDTATDDRCPGSTISRRCAFNATQRDAALSRLPATALLVEFASAVDAVTCAVAVQEKMAARTAEGTEPRIQFRFGINVGDIIIDGDDIFGDGVNVAAPRRSAPPTGLWSASVPY